MLFVFARENFPIRRREDRVFPKVPLAEEMLQKWRGLKMQKHMLHYSVNIKGSPSSCGLIIGLTQQSIGHSLFRFMFKIHRLPLIPDDRFILNFCEVVPFYRLKTTFWIFPPFYSLKTINKIIFFNWSTWIPTPSYEDNPQNKPNIFWWDQKKLGFGSESYFLELMESELREELLAKAWEWSLRDELLRDWV